MPDNLEIERKYLLSGLPTIPAEVGAQRLEIEQGYLDAAHVPADDAEKTAEHIREGRIRRTVFADGPSKDKVLCTHTIKRGFGMVREETEKEITSGQFEKLWPATEKMRLRKTRWVIMIDHAEWAIDQFHDLDLVLAEVEIPAVDSAIDIPAWLKPTIVRDVTDEVEYVNSTIAKRVGEV